MYFFRLFALFESALSEKIYYDMKDSVNDFKNFVHFSFHKMPNVFMYRDRWPLFKLNYICIFKVSQIHLLVFRIHLFKIILFRNNLLEQIVFEIFFF